MLLEKGLLMEFSCHIVMGWQWFWFGFSRSIWKTCDSKSQQSSCAASLLQSEHSDFMVSWPQRASPCPWRFLFVLRVQTFCIPGLHLHVFVVLISAFCFRRWSWIEVLPAKVWLMGWHSKPRAGFGYYTLLRVGRGHSLGVLSDYVIVITQRLNSTAASFEVCMENLLLWTKDTELTPVFLLPQIQRPVWLCVIFTDRGRAGMSTEPLAMGVMMAKWKALHKKAPGEWRVSRAHSRDNLCWDTVIPNSV